MANTKLSKPNHGFIWKLKLIRTKVETEVKKDLGQATF